MAAVMQAEKFHDKIIKSLEGSEKLPIGHTVVLDGAPPGSVGSEGVHTPKESKPEPQENKQQNRKRDTAEPSESGGRRISGR